MHLVQRCSGFRPVLITMAVLTNIHKLENRLVLILFLKGAGMTRPPETVCQLFPKTIRPVKQFAPVNNSS